MTALERAVLYEFVQQWKAAHDNPHNMCDELIFSELPLITPLEELLNGTTEDDYLRAILDEREACAKVCDEWKQELADLRNNKAVVEGAALYEQRHSANVCARRIRDRNLK